MKLLNPDPKNWSNEDLEWLSFYANSRILGLGEVIHTSDGFYSSKVRLIKYLIAFHDFRAVAFESPWGRALSVTECVRGNGTDPLSSLFGLFRVWRSQSVYQLIRFMVEWNTKNPEDPVRFFGIDTQQPEWDLKCLLSFSQISKKDKTLLIRLFKEMFGESIFRDQYYSSSDFQLLMKNGFTTFNDHTEEINNILDHLELEKTQLEYAARISLKSFLYSTVEDVLGKFKNTERHHARSFAFRDKCMSDLTIHFAGNDKTLLWAHNHHIQRPSKEFVDGMSFQGQFLKQKLSDKYKALALTANKIEINWPWAKIQPPVFPENAIETILAKNYLNQAIYMNSSETDKLGASEYCAYYKSDINHGISERFDGLLYLPYSGPVEYTETSDK